MSALIEPLAALRRRIARIEGRAVGPANGTALCALGHAEADARLGGGLERAALHEVFAKAEADMAAASGFALGLSLRAARSGALVWIRQDLSALENGEPFGAGLLEWGVHPARVILVAVPRPLDALKAAGEALACGAVGAVVIEARGEAAAFDLTASRRLALAAERAGATALLLRAGAELVPSAARTRWLVKAAPSIGASRELGQPVVEAELVRSRKGVTGAWLMEWDGDALSFRQVETASGAVASAPRHRQDQARGLRRAG